MHNTWNQVELFPSNAKILFTSKNRPPASLHKTKHEYLSVFLVFYNSCTIVHTLYNMVWYISVYLLFSDKENVIMCGNENCI